MKILHLSEHIHKLLSRGFNRLSRESNFVRDRVKALRHNRLKFAVIVLGISVFSLLGYYLSEKLVISLGGSVSKHVFWKVGSFPQRGDYVIVRSSALDSIAKGNLLTKKIACMPGDTLIIAFDDYYCNNTNTYIGRALRKSSSGQPLVPFNPCGNTQVCHYVIPGGYFFVVGDHPRSYDSRYFGPIPGKNIVSVIKPIF